MDAEEERRRTAGLREQTRGEIIGKLGQAFWSMPEAEKFTEDQKKTLIETLRGVPEDDLVGAFAVAYTNQLAEVRAEERYQARHQKELEAELKARDTEHAVKKVQTRQAPSGRQPATGNAQDNAEPDWQKQPKEWAAWDKEQQRAGRGIYANARR